MIRPMRALLAPGVALMNRLRYPQKFALVSLVFAIPLGLMMYLWLAEIGDRLAFARKERAGLEYVVAVRRLLEPLALTPLGFAPLGLGSPDLAAAAAGVDVVDARLGSELQATETWQGLRRKLADPSAGRGTRIADTVQLIAHVGDTSNLILDPDLDTYYLMEATVTLLPALAVQLSVIEDRAASVPSVAAQGDLRRRPRPGAGGARRRGARPYGSVPRQPAPHLDAGAPPERFGRGGRRARDRGGERGWRARDRRRYPTAPQRRCAPSSRTTTRPPWHSTGCSRRAWAGSRGRRTSLLLLVAVTIAVVAYLWAAFYGAMLQAVVQLDRVSKRMLTGDFTRRVVLESSGRAAPGGRVLQQHRCPPAHGVGAGRRGDAREVRFPRHDEPRDPHAAERRPRHAPPAARHPAQRAPAALRARPSASRARRSSAS